MEKRYTVAQAVRLTGVKSYVLRYWEEEMGLAIGRNELGHRYYTGYDIQLFMNIKELKNRGLQLKAIRELLPRLSENAAENPESAIELPAETLPQEEALIQESPKIIRKEEAFVQNIQEKEPEKKDSKILEFQDILERLIRQELHAKREGEDRWRSIDQAIRRQQQARREAAAAKEKKNRKKSWCKDT